ncbi:MAG: succinate dehydrogenase, cytochrome b556 subunit [Alphaproteobacteria bacterium PA4]|nr:MAG: succinate dehydrogenase, cytochrome b556 subunit [Alphaproteobacteria bacterium PA4]
MAGRPTAPRPLSPHMTIWKWRVHAVVSILHRITGNAMALGGVMLFLWWLVAAASGPEAYQIFMGVATGWFGLLIAFGLTWVFFQHLCSGIRHLIMDSGEGFDLDTSRTLASATLVASTLLTILTWIVIAMTKGL